jgi:hypothetical protein
MSSDWEVKKIAYTIPISTEMAMDCGLIPDTREPVKISRRRQWRWRFGDWRWRRRMRLASWVAGFDVENRDY